jgi:hypothetical protein
MEVEDVRAALIGLERLERERERRSVAVAVRLLPRHALVQPDDALARATLLRVFVCVPGPRRG